MRATWLAVTIGLAGLVATPARGQDQKSPEELQKLYDEAVVQLKAAQDRKNEMASENEKLQTRIVELETMLNQRNLEASEQAEKTWSLRARSAAWDRFISKYPEWKARWDAFLASELLDPINESILATPGTTQPAG